MNESRPAVAYLVSHPIQYQAPLFRLLAGSRAIAFEAVFGCRHGVEATFDPGFGRAVHFGVEVLVGYSHQFVEQATRKPSVGRFWGLRLRHLGGRFLPPGRLPDVAVLHGWRTVMMWQAAHWCRRHRVPYLLRAENPIYECHRPPPPGPRRRLLRWLLRRGIVGPAAGALVLGSANRRFWDGCGLGSDRQFSMPYFIDDVAVARAAVDGRAQSAGLRRKFGIAADAFVVVSSGKLLPRKRPFDLLDSLAGLPERIVVLWLGSGELEPALRQRIAAVGMEKRFLLAGFQPAEKCWQLMGQADLFAIPAADEWWGLVVNEAVAAGLPVLSSDHVAAAEDLVLPGRTGDLVPCGDVAAWRRALAGWHTRLGAGGAGFDRAAAAELSQRHSLVAAAAGFERAATSVWRATRVARAAA